MPPLSRRMIFISRARTYSEHYWKLVEWFNGAANFLWANCSVPSHDALPDKSSKGLSEGMTRQIIPASVVVVLGGMYAAYSSWIDYEIREAQRLEKVIIGVRPWGRERVPLIVQNASICEPVGWNSGSIIDAIRTYA
jgi:hypothetical protein